MACYCGVCADRICEQWENYGPFPTTKEFIGWDVRSDCKNPRVRDLCEDCFKAMAEAATSVANSIVEQRREQVDKLVATIKEQDAADERLRRERSEFEEAWRAHRAATETGR